MNREEFDRVVERSGLRRKYIAARLGIGYSNFVKKTTGEIQWKMEEMQMLRDILGLTDEEIILIFFDVGSTNSRLV